MTIETTPIQDLVIIQPTVFEDTRGYFFEAYKPQSVTYLDADLFFYNSVGDVVQEAEAYDAGIVGHRFKLKMKHLE